MLACAAVTGAGEDVAARLSQLQWSPLARAPGYSEGPAWRDGEVLFCSGALMRITGDGRLEKFLDVQPAGTLLRGDGHLMICDNKHKALLDLSPEGTLGVVVDEFEGKPLRSLNDLTIDAQGNVYWTDPAGSSLEQPIGNIFRVTPAGVVARVASGLAFPNGIDVDPSGKHLLVVESRSTKILKYDIPEDDKPLGDPVEFYDLAGSGGDGCAFDAQGNLWVADFHRPETDRGRITVIDPQGNLLGSSDVPAKVVSNLTFGGENHDEIFCTTGSPDGVFHAPVGIQGFAGHPGKPMKLVRQLAVAPEDPASPVHPRRFGVPGSVGQTRGWYVWHAFDPVTRQAAVSHEGTGERYSVRVLPWCATYRHLVYGAHPDELLPGERVNLFFNPDEKQRRAYLVHYQDEICQMKGHNHAWQVRSVSADGGRFTAQVMAGDQPLIAEDEPAAFTFDAACRILRDGQPAERSSLKVGDRIYMTWVYRDDQRIARLVADDASLDVVKAEEHERVAERVAREGMAGFVEEVKGGTVQLLIFGTHWAQAGKLAAGRLLLLQASSEKGVPQGRPIAARLVSRKNLGTYGSGATVVAAELTRPQDSQEIAGWAGSNVIRIRAQ